MQSKKLNVLAVIPARLGSTRLSQKPLRDICGKTLIQRVWEQACKAEQISKVVIATDSEEIANHASKFGADTIMTSADLNSGSARVAAALRLLNDVKWDIVINVQGDMPLISPVLIDNAINFLSSKREQFSIATIAAPILNQEHFLSHNVVKVVVNQKNEAMYFSRSPIPFSRDGVLQESEIDGKKITSIYGFKHFGLYLFTPEGLDAFSSNKTGVLDQVEKLEQLKPLEEGYKIGVLIVDPELTEASVEVDTEEDLQRASQIAKLLEIKNN
jgi:3-deoxy-manno-octulosonate cytidylyltransferase (CMP-KDO synthetase)